MRASLVGPWVAVLALIVGVVLPGCRNSVEESPAPPAAAPSAAAPAAFRPVVSVNALMVGWIDDAAHVVWDVEKEGMAPKNDREWVNLEDHAIQLAAAGTLIELGGTGVADPGWITQRGWKENAEKMTVAALELRDAATRHDLKQVTEANGKLVESCEACHDAFKPELPSEGIAHQIQHSDSHDARR